jgi:ParB family chromosome partitioning protein
MAKEKGLSEADFIRTLKSQEASAKPQGMVLNKPPQGQGKSLDELLSGNAPNQTGSNVGNEVAAESGSIFKVALHLLADSPFQPRLKYDETYIHDLAGSLQEVGQKEVITVRPVGSGFEIINGHCRVRAAQLVGWTDIEARVVAADNREAELSALVQNETRKDLTEYERARLYKRAIDAGLARTQSGAAKIFGRSEGRISQALSMLGLPQPILDLLNQHPALFGYRTAKDILDLLKRHPDEEALITQAVERLLNGAQASSIKGWVEQALSNRRGRPKKAEPIKVSNLEGQVVFKVKGAANQIVIDLAPGTDFELVWQWVVDDLRKRIGS